jgi:hypothetical protein
MPGLVIGGQEVLVPGLNIINYRDDPRCALKLGKEMRIRNTRWVRAIGHHNTKNIETTLLPGAGKPVSLAIRLVDFWSLDSTKPAGAHTCVDCDGTVYCMADLLLMAAYHAGLWNEVSVGNEIYEDSKGRIYQAQLDATVKLTEFLCQYFGIQRQCPPPGYPEIKRIADNIMRGKDCVGVFGHCHQWQAGKAHDPGRHLFEALIAAGFRTFDFNKLEDKEYWSDIQTKMGLQADGVPGPDTRDALHARGFEHGLYDFHTAVTL